MKHCEANKSGSYDDHAHLGAEYARKLLNELALTTDEEMDIICSAVWHHDNKAEADDPMDEILAKFALILAWGFHYAYWHNFSTTK